MIFGTEHFKVLYLEKGLLLKGKPEKFYECCFFNFQNIFAFLGIYFWVPLMVNQCEIYSRYNSARVIQTI